LRFMAQLLVEGLVQEQGPFGHVRDGQPAGEDRLAQTAADLVGEGWGHDVQGNRITFVTEF
jgi:hypothetical protein